MERFTFGDPSDAAQGFFPYVLRRGSMIAANGYVPQDCGAQSTPLDPAATALALSGEGGPGAPALDWVCGRRGTYDPALMIGRVVQSIRMTLDGVRISFTDGAAVGIEASWRVGPEGFSPYTLAYAMGPS